MHNCKETREIFTELLLDGIDFRSDQAISAELRRCSECRSEFETLSATLRMTSRVSEVATPAEDYWPAYHAKLRQRLVDAQTPTTSRAQAQGTRKNSGLSLSLCDLARETVCS
jgi:predicted anti-sigma-YlaC factor YlaD